MKVKGNPFQFNGEEFSKRIKGLRLRFDLTQEEVANALKKTRGLYGGCENGNFTPGLEVLIGLREFYKKKGLHVSMDYLFGFSEKIGGDAGVSDSAKEIKMLKDTLAEKNTLIETQKDLISLMKVKKG